MRRRTLASLLSALLIAAGLTALTASPAQAAGNQCTQSNVKDMIDPLRVFYAADGGNQLDTLVVANPSTQTLLGTTFYKWDLGVTGGSATAFQLSVNCAGSYYTQVAIQSKSTPLPVGAKFSLYIDDIVRPLAMAASAGEVGMMDQTTGTQIWGKVVADNSVAGNTPIWLFYIANDAWASNSDWLGTACGAAMAGSTVTEAPLPTIAEFDNANVTISSANGKLEMSVAGNTGESAEVNITVPDFYLNSSACGWNLGITSSTTNDEVKAKVQATYGSSSTDFSVAADSQNKTHTFTIKTLALRSKQLRAGTETTLVVEPKTSNGGGGGSNTNGGGTTPAAKKAQSATSTPVIPASVKWKKKMVLLKSAVTTDAGQKATAVVTCAKSMKCKAKTSASGAVTVTTKKKTGKITLTLSAPATATYDAYSLVKVIKLKK